MRNTFRVLKVKIQETSKGKVILIGWETKSENGWERQTLKSKDTPRPELYNVMRTMGLHALRCANWNVNRQIYLRTGKRTKLL